MSEEKKTVKHKIKYRNSIFKRTKQENRRGKLEDLIWDSALSEVEDGNILKDNLEKNSILFVGKKENPARLARIEKKDYSIKNVLTGEIIFYQKENEIELLKNIHSKPEYFQIGGYTYISVSHFYFMIVEDHLVFISRPARDDRMIERYINKFLKKNRTIYTKEKILLTPKIELPDDAMKGQIAEVHIKLTQETKQLKLAQRTTKKKSALKPGIIKKNLLSAISGNADMIENMDRKGELNKLNIKCSIQGLMNWSSVRIEEIFRLIEDDDLTFIGEDGTEYDSDIKLSVTKEIPTVKPESDRLDPNGVDKIFSDVLAKWYEEEKISFSSDRLRGH